MQNIIDDKTLDASQSIIHHREVVDLLPSNIELSGFEVRLINTMSRERVLKTYVKMCIRDRHIHLMICLKEQRNFHGKIIFQRMDVSG